jgi:phosphoglycerate dehydrogenase-like enzyme
LRFVQALSASYDQFPLETLAGHGIALASASGLHDVAAEHAITMLLTLVRDIKQSVHDGDARVWHPRPALELSGGTIVILGLGAIGMAIANRLVPFEVCLIGVTRQPANHPDFPGDVQPLSGLMEACLPSLAIVVAIPLAETTRGLVSAKVLDSLGRGYVVNVARGPIVDEAAMVDRLRDGRLRGAGLDVFEQEPLALESVLWNLPNVVITPHMAGMGQNYPGRLAGLLGHNLRALAGEVPWRNRIV